MSNTLRNRWRSGVIGSAAVWVAMAQVLGGDQQDRPRIDAATMHGKVMSGYQGWFRCPGDGAGEGWKHWGRDREKLTPDRLTFEMWPDLTEFGDDEKYPAPGFTLADGRQAYLFSSANGRTVERHFNWMKQYGIDGVFVQRFLVEASRPSSDRVLNNVRRAAISSGRVYALCYDLSGAKPEKIFDLLTADWKRLVDQEKITQDDRYLHDHGKPVLFVWGFYSDRFGPALANQIIDFLKTDPKYAVTLVGGCEWPWRRSKDAQWAKAFRRFDVISPWNVGNITRINGVKEAATGYWKDDLAEAKQAGISYLPVIYPGFGWTNLKGKDPSAADIPRRGGDFYWRQFSIAAGLGIDMAYVAMFDEVDEGTAIFKVSDTPPTPGHFVTYDGLPLDWYLRLTGEGSKLIRGERENQLALPIKP